MTLIDEADKILQKDNLTIKDYNRFVEIGKKLTKPDDESSDLSDTESEEKSLGTRDKNYVIVEDGDDNYESQEEKDPKKISLSC